MTRRCGRWPTSSSEALTVVVDAARELGGYLDELPVDASALDTKLARQAELRTLTRKYAADIDGVLRWARESRDRLAQLDVSEEALAGLERRVDELAVELAKAAVDLSKVRAKAAKRLAKEVTAELSGLAMADAEFTIDGDDHAGQLRRSRRADACLRRRGPCRRRRRRPGRVRLRRAPRHDGAAAGQERVRRRIVPGDAGPGGGAGRRRTTGTTMVFDEVDAGVGGRAAVQIGRRLARLARNQQVIVVTHLPQVAAYADVHLMVDSTGKNGASGVRRLTATTGLPSWPGCWPGSVNPTPGARTPANCSRPQTVTVLRPEKAHLSL